MIYCFFFFSSNCFPIAYSEMTVILSELVSGGLGFHHETQLPERILQSEDASCVIMVILHFKIYLFVLFTDKLVFHSTWKLHSHDIYL